MNDRRLARLRERIRRIDREVLALARERIAVAERIGRLKLAHALPVRDYRTETEVLARAARICARLGLDRSLGQEIVRALISGAVRAQEVLREGHFTGTRQRVSILGGRGKMGAWFARYLHSRGHQVTSFDPRGPLRGFRSTRSFDKAVDEAEIVLVSVPLAAARQVYAEVRARRPAGLVLDICSLKAPILREIRAARRQGLRVSSIHPLFGPDVYLLSERILLICPCGDAGADRQARALFAGTSLELAEVDVTEHDRQMGLVLGLSHAVNIVFNEALARSGRRGSEVRRFATTTYLKQSRTARELAAENPLLYHEIQHGNPASPEVHALFERAFRAFRRAARRRDPGEFVALMARARRFHDS